MIPVEKILEAIIEQAKQGSCKTCRWCEPVDDSGTRQCAIQSNVNSIILDVQSLNEQAYPARCAEGEWADAYECLAYVPALRAIPQDNFDIDTAACDHRNFMIALGDAIDLSYKVRHNVLARLTAQLNEAKESLPKPRTGGNSKLDDFLNSLGVL